MVSARTRAVRSSFCPAALAHSGRPPARLTGETPVQLYLFDLLHHGPDSLLGLPCTGRRDRLQVLGLDADPIRTPVPVDRRDVVTEVPAPAAARTVTGDALAQPVPLRRPGCRSGVQDQARQLAAASLVIRPGPGPGGHSRGVAVLDLGRPAARPAVSDLLPVLPARPGQLRVTALSAGELLDRVLRAENSTSAPVSPETWHITALRSSEVLMPQAAAMPSPPAAASPGGRGQPDHFPIRQLDFPAEAGGKLGSRLVHG